MNSETNIPAPTPEDTIPLWFLDVDGVINALPNHSKDNVLDYQTFNASPNCWSGMTDEERWDAELLPGGTYRYKITYNPSIIERMKKMHESGIVRVVWLTTWGRGANNELREKLGLPRFASAGEPTYRHSGGWSGAALMHTDDTNTWWKWGCIQEYLARFPRTEKFVWTDDHLAMEQEAFDWATKTEGLAIAPNERTGLTHEDLDRIEEYLTC